MFDALHVIGSGMHVGQAWMDAISDNLANINTAMPTSGPAFQARYILAQSLEGRATGNGVGVAGVMLGNPVGRLTYDPGNPLADAKGYIRLPDIDLGEQMTTMIMAERGYQANIANLDRVRETYQATIQMGRV